MNTSSMDDITNPAINDDPYEMENGAVNKAQEWSKGQRQKAFAKTRTKTTKQRVGKMSAVLGDIERQTQVWSACSVTLIAFSSRKHFRSEKSSVSTCTE